MHMGIRRAPFFGSTVGADLCPQAVSNRKLSRFRQALRASRPLGERRQTLLQDLTTQREHEVKAKRAMEQATQMAEYSRQEANRAWHTAQELEQELQHVDKLIAERSHPPGAPALNTVLQQILASSAGSALPPELRALADSALQGRPPPQGSPYQASAIPPPAPQAEGPFAPAPLLSPHTVGTGPAAGLVTAVQAGGVGQPDAPMDQATDGGPQAPSPQGAGP